VLTFLNVNYNISAVIAFLVAVTQNYQLNKKWTFRDHNTKTRKKFPKYIALNFFSFLVNIAVLNLVVLNFGDEKLVQIAGSDGFQLFWQLSYYFCKTQGE